MFRLVRKLPRKIAIAVSGGVDSMVFAHFLSNNHDVTIYNVDYSSDYSNKCQKLINETFPNLQRYFSPPFPRPYKNKEAVWREQRYSCFASWYEKDSLPIVLGHHLNDVAETYLFGAANGNPKIMSVDGPSNTVRPFLGVTKEQILWYAKRHSIPYLEDPTNSSQEHMRNIIRANVLPQVLSINKGFLSVVRKKVLQENGVIKC